MDRGPRATRVRRAAEGEADDAPIRAAGEFCRPVHWLTRGFAATRVTKDQGECREIRPAPMFRKAFTVAKTSPGRASTRPGSPTTTSRSTARRVRRACSTRGFTDYSRTVLYTTDDVTALLHPGENVIASELGSGHFDDAARTWDWGWDEAQWRATPRLRLDLYISYTDGTEQVVASDGSWRVSMAGPTRYDSYYLGETYDARREIPGWSAPASTTRAGPRPRREPRPRGHARGDPRADPVVDTAPAGTRRSPRRGLRLRHRPEPHRWAEIGVRAPAGTPIEIFYSEKLGRRPSEHEGNDLVFGQLQTDYYMASGRATSGGRRVSATRASSTSS